MEAQARLHCESDRSYMQIGTRRSSSSSSTNIRRRGMKRGSVMKAAAALGCFFATSSTTTTVQGFVLPSHSHSRRRDAPSGLTPGVGPSGSNINSKALLPLSRHQTPLLHQRLPFSSPSSSLLRRSASPQEQAEDSSSNGASEDAPLPSSLRQEIKDKLKSLFGAMSNMMVPEEEEKMLKNVASSLSKTKGGAGGPSLMTEVKTSTTTSLLDIGMNPCEHAVTPVTNDAACVDHKLKSTAASASSSYVPKTTTATAAALGQVPEPVNENIARISEYVPNTWLAICHSASLKPKELKKVYVDDKPICLFRTSTGEVKAISDICLHRYVFLFWVGIGRLLARVCLYTEDGSLNRMT